MTNDNNNKHFESKIIVSGYVSTKSEQLQCEQMWINKLHPTLHLVNAYIGKPQMITCKICGKILLKSSLNNHIKSKYIYHKRRLDISQKN